MTKDRKMKDLKAVAKKIARSKRVDHHVGLNLVAKELGHANWYALWAAYKAGWQVSPEDLNRAEHLLAKINPSAASNSEIHDGVSLMFGNPGGESAGHIGEHEYHIDVEMDDVFMRGRGWLVHVPEAPSRPPAVQVTDRRFKTNPIHDAAFVEKALKIANAKAEQVRARIASDWPRRATRPDANGLAVHPLSGEEGDTWHCLHCDGQAPSKAMAANLWHCPSCHAAPIDIFNGPWWRGDDEQPAEEMSQEDV